MFELLAELVFEFAMENSPKARMVVEKVLGFTQPSRDSYARAEIRFSHMSDEQLIRYAKQNKERLKNTMEGFAAVKEIQDRGLIEEIKKQRGNNMNS